MATPLPSGLLLLPPPGDRTCASLRRKVRLLAARDLLAGPRKESRVLEDLLRQAPGPTLDAIGAPDVLPFLLAQRNGLLDAETARRRAWPNLLAALHARGVTPREALLVEAPITALHGLRAGHVAFDEPARALLLDAAGLSVELADGSHADPAELASPSSHALPDSHIELCLADSNPLSHLEDHPDKAGNAVDLGGHPLPAWLSALREALDVVRATLPTWYAELPATLSRLVPVGYEPERHLSASYGDAPGLAYLTLHPSALTLAEAIVHETQHGKLNLLLWLDKVLVNGRTDWAESPVRPDLRPLMGVLLAVHAFVPVAALHLALAEQDHPLSRSPEFARRRAQVLAGNEGGLQVLRERADPTASGRRLLADLEELHAVAHKFAPETPMEQAQALPPG